MKEKQGVWGFLFILLLCLFGGHFVSLRGVFYMQECSVIELPRATEFSLYINFTESLMNKQWFRNMLVFVLEGYFNILKHSANITAT